MDLKTMTIIVEALQGYEELLDCARLRDFYDIYLLTSNTEFSWDTLVAAFNATCIKRNTNFTKETANKVLRQIRDDAVIEKNWELFKKKNSFVDTTEWKDILSCLDACIEKLFA